jgi:hypothetical protein
MDDAQQEPLGVIVSLLDRVKASRALNEMPGIAAHLREALLDMELDEETELSLLPMIAAIECAQSSAEAKRLADELRESMVDHDWPYAEDDQTQESQASAVPCRPLPAPVISELLAIFESIEQAQTLDDVARGIASAREVLMREGGTSDPQPEAPAADQTAPAETDQAEGAAAPEVQAENAGGK